MGPNAPNMGDIKKKLNDMKANIQRVTDRFQNHKETTFVCVCIPGTLHSDWHIFSISWLTNFA